MVANSEAGLLRDIDTKLADGISVEVSNTGAIGENNVTTLAGSVLIDAFGRQRTSEPNTLFDTKYLYDTQPLLWDDLEASGNGATSTYVQAEACVRLAVQNGIAGRRVRQTKQRFNYQSGKSFQVFRTAANWYTNRNRNGLWWVRLAGN